MKLGALPIQSNKIIMPKFWRKISLWILNKYFRTHHSKIEMKVYWLSQELNCHIKKYIIDSWKSAEKNKICFNESILQKGEEYIFTGIFVAFCWKHWYKFRNRCQTRPRHSYVISVAGKNFASRIFDGTGPTLEMNKEWEARTKSSGRSLVHRYICYGLM